MNKMCLHERREVTVGDGPGGGKAARRLRLDYYLIERVGGDGAGVGGGYGIGESGEAELYGCGDSGGVGDAGEFGESCGNADVVEGCGDGLREYGIRITKAYVSPKDMAAGGVSSGDMTAKDLMTEEVTVEGITTDRALARELLWLLADNSVTPIGVADVLEDLVASDFLLARPNLMSATA